MDHSKCVITKGHKLTAYGQWVNNPRCLTHNMLLPESPADPEWIRKMNFAESLNKAKQDK